MRSKEMMIIGAGKIGRGYLSDLYSEAGFHLIFVNSKTDTIDKLNEAGKYTIFISNGDKLDKKIISDYEAYALSRDFDKIADRLCDIDIASIALYPSAYDDVAELIAEACRRRYKKNISEALNYVMFVNYVRSAKIMKEKVNKLLNEEENAYFKEHIGITEALTLRGGIQPTPEMLAEDPLCISTNYGRVMPVGDEFVGGRPTEIPFYNFVDRIEGRLIIKVWCGNMRHCTTANCGQFLGYTFTYECANDPYVVKIVEGASKEANYGVKMEYGFEDSDFPGNDWTRMRNSNDKDYVTRVAADPIRKLSRNERYIGPALLCMKHGQVPYYLARGAAYELLFKNDKDANAVKLQKMIKEVGIEEALWQVSGLDRNIKHEKALHELIIKTYNEIID